MKIKSIEDIEKENFVGIDKNLKISLREYGIAWKERTDEEGTREFLFLYKGYNGNFYWGHVPKNIDPKTEWDWVNWDEISDFSGYDILKDFEEKLISLPDIVVFLIRYYGIENIFGADIWEGMKIEGID